MAATDRMTYEDAVRLVEESIAERGSDYVYEPLVDRGDYDHNIGCAYVHRDGHGDPIPGCLVGMALIKWGVDPEVFDEHEINVDHDSTSVITKLREEGSLGGIDPYAEIFFQRVQAVQDRQESWGSALTKAKEYVESFD